MNGSLRRIILTWWQASRYHFVPPSLFPAAIGSIVSWASFNNFSFYYFVLVMVGITINHIALNMTDDYFDYKHAVDNAENNEKNPYSGGSKTLTNGLIQPQKMVEVFSILYILVVIIGLYLTVECGLFVLFFGLFGLFWSIFYTSPPIKFAYHGFGELGMLLNFGPIIGLGAFFVQAQQVSLEAFLATLPCGIMLFSMIIINEIPDLKDDKRAGKLTLVARFGKKVGLKLYIISWIFTYCVVLFSVLFSFLPWPVLLSFISLPFVFDSIRILVKNYSHPDRLFLSNKRMIHAHALTSFGIIFGYMWHGFSQNTSVFQMYLFVIILLFLYVPSLFPPLQLKK